MSKVISINSKMKKETIGGFVVKELPKVENTNENENAKCWTCGKYGTRSTMVVKNHKYYCEKCK